VTLVLGLDPGALNMGYAFLRRHGDKYQYLDSGIDGVTRLEDEGFQDYKWRLIHHWVTEFPHYLSFLNENADPGEKVLIASEIVPAVGSGNFSVATQSDLAKAAITVCQVIAVLNGFEWEEISSSTVKKAVYGMASKPPKKKGGKRGKVTKVNVVDAVCEALPGIKGKRKEFVDAPDQSDGLAVALTALGYKRPRPIT
jgi:Holliday junction resolvasome RuvABC endonuclease subunit